MHWEVDGKSRQAPHRHRQGGQGRRPADPRHRPRPRGRGDLLARARGAEAARRLLEGQAGRARRLQRHHQAGGARGDAPSARRSTTRWSTPISPAARSTISSASRSRRCCGASCPAPARPAACSRWRCAWSATARTRSRPSARANTGRSRSRWRPPSGGRFVARARRLRRQEARPPRHPRRGDGATRSRRRCAPGDFRVASVEAKPVRRNPSAALHHLDAAAGGLAQARLLRRAHHAGRAAPLRGRRDRRRDGRPHHLHAHRRRADRAGGDRGDARARSRTNFGERYLPDEPRNYPTKAKNAQEAHEAIRPTDCRPPAGIGRPLARARPGAALRADLEAHRREPDGVRRARAHHGRDRRRHGDRPRGAPRHRPGRALRRLPRRSTRRDATTMPRTRKAAACRRWRPATG